MVHSRASEGLQVGRSEGVSWRADAPAFAVNGVPAYQDSTWLRERRDEGLDIQTMAERAGTSYHTIRKYLKKFGLQFTAQEKAKLSGLVQRGTRRTFKKPRHFTEAWREAVRGARKGSASIFGKAASAPSAKTSDAGRASKPLGCMRGSTIAVPFAKAKPASTRIMWTRFGTPRNVREIFRT